MARLTEAVFLRVTPELRQRLEREAIRLGLRPVDVARMALAKGLADLEAGERRLLAGNGQREGSDADRHEQ